MTPPSSPRLRMVAYTRVSLAREDMISPEIQQAAQDRWAADHGAVIVGRVSDLDASGRTLKRKIGKAIAVVEAGEADGILVYRYDRWGRNAAESLANVALVERAGGRVVSVTEPLDPETTIGRFTRTQALAIAEMQSDLIGDNWKAVHASRRDRKLPAAGGPRFGYVRLGKVPDPVRRNVLRRDMSDPLGERYEPDPGTAAVLAELYRRFAAGEPVRELVRWLNEAEVKTAWGGAWGRRAMVNMLDTGFGAGLLRVHDPACRCQRDAQGCPRVLYLPGAHSPVVTMEEWEAYLERRRSRAQAPGRARDPVYALSGLLRCGACQSVLVSGYAYGQRGYCYRCPGKSEGRCAAGVFVRRDRAEREVLAWLSDLLGDAREQEPVERRRAASAASAKSKAARAERKIARVTKGLANLAAARALDPLMPPEAWEQARDKLLAALEAAREDLKAAKAGERAATVPYIPVVEGLIAEWETFTPAERRVILSRVVRHIEVRNTGFRKPAKILPIPAWDSE